MLFRIINVCSAFIFSAIFTGVLIPKILLISFRKSLFDEQNERKIHRGTVPRLGGLAFKPVIFFSMSFLLGVNILLGEYEILYSLKENAIELLFGSCSIIILYLIGVADDLIGVKYRAKFFIQFLCGILLIISGLWINNLYGILGIYTLSPFIGYPLTIFVVVFIINAINLIDGIDGLASGLSGVALFFYGLAFIHFNQYLYALLAFSTLGAIVPFFYYNVFGNVERGKKIFMGDTGSLTIGIILCILGIKICTVNTTETIIYNPFLLACIPLMIPCFDVVRVVVYRFRSKKHLFKPDTNHIHHKVLKIGISQRRAMITILSISSLFILSNTLLSPIVNINILLFCDIFICTSVNIWLTVRIKQKQSNLAPINEND